jgi:hypothetical protein
MLWEFTDGNHIGGFLELHCLVVDEATFRVDDHVWIHWAVFTLTIGGGTGRASVTTLVDDQGLDRWYARIAHPG